MRKGLYPVGFVFIAYGMGVLFLDLNFPAAALVILIGTLIASTPYILKDVYQVVPLWKALIIDSTALIVILWALQYFFKPMSFHDIELSTIKDPLTYFTEQTIVIFDVGIGYIAWISVFLLVLSAFSAAMKYISKYGQFGAMVFFAMMARKSKENSPERLLFGMSSSTFTDIFATYLPIFLYVFATFRWYFPLVKFLDDVIFGMHFPTTAFRISQPINRLTEVFASIGAAPSFGKISASFLTITTLWGSYEGASKMFSIAVRFLWNKKGADESENEVKNRPVV